MKTGSSEPNRLDILYRGFVPRADRERQFTLAAEANVAFWIRRGTNELDGCHLYGSADDLTWEPPEAACRALATPDKPFEQHEQVAGLVAAMAALVTRRPFVDHTRSAAAIVREFRERVEFDVRRNATDRERSNPRHTEDG